MYCEKGVKVMKRTYLKGLPLLMLGVVLSLGPSAVYGARGLDNTFRLANEREQKGLHAARLADDAMHKLQNWRTLSGEGERPRTRVAEPDPDLLPFRAQGVNSRRTTPSLRLSGSTGLLILILSLARQAHGAEYDFSNHNESDVIAFTPNMSDVEVFDPTRVGTARPPNLPFDIPQGELDDEEPVEVKELKRSAQYYEQGAFEESANILQRLARGKNPEALYKLGVLHRRGEGVPKDLGKTERLWREAANKGNIEATADLGALYMSRKEYKKAVPYLVEAVEFNDPDAQANLAMIYYDGLDGSEATPEKQKEAIKLWRKSAQGGNPIAQTKLGLYYYDVKKDPDEAKEWWRKAAEKKEPEALYTLGALSYEEGDQVTAKNWWMQAALQGQPNAEYNLGLLAYEEGEHATAKEWWRKAALQGHPKAQRYLGSYYYNIELNYVEAERWWSEAARKGDPVATDELQKLQEEKRKR